MNIKFLENQLYRVFCNAPSFETITLQGEFAYVRLNGTVAKVEMKETGFDVTILSTYCSKVDSKYIGFDYILGQKPNNNQNGCIEVTPRLHEQYVSGMGDKTVTNWYGYEPNDADYRDMYRAIMSYIWVFDPDALIPSVGHQFK